MSNDLIDLMVKRVSYPRLVPPCPSPQVLEKIFQAALRTPDHMKLMPWRYLVIEGEGLIHLGELFCRAAELDDKELDREEQEKLAQEGIVQHGLSAVQKEKYLNMPKRAPMVIVGISRNLTHSKVPVDEQINSCAVGIGYMLLALQATGFGGIWRTGPFAKHAHVKKELNILEHETIVGFLYLGTPQGKAKPIPDINASEFFQPWI